jgi:hypothetical protein
MTQKDEALKALKYLDGLSWQLKRYSDDGSYPHIDSRVSAGKLYEFAKEIDTVIEKCKAALSDAVTLPDGWVAVPVEPTDEMLNRAADFCDFSHETYRHIYKAMLQAAPTCEKKKG